VSLGPEVISQFSHLPQLNAKACVFLYTDPGSGALLFQLLGASGLMVMFYFSRVRDSIRRIFGLKVDPHHTGKQPDGNVGTPGA
jgi:hypothetical protein